MVIPWDWIIATATFVVSGGIIGALASLLGVWLQTRSDSKRAEIKRNQELADRSFDLKREAYTEAIKEFNYSAVVHLNNSTDRSLTAEELLRRNSAITLFDIYAPDYIKSTAAEIMRLLQEDAPIIIMRKEHSEYKSRLITQIQQLTEQAKMDLGIE